MTFQTIYAKALSYLAQREHSHYQLSQKLQRKFPEESEVIEQVLAQLAQENYQSEQRFALSYIHSRAARGYGPKKIAYELQQRGLSKSLVHEALSTCELDWAEVREQARQKKFGIAPVPREFSAKAKQFSYLQQRGFEWD